MSKLPSCYLATIVLVFFLITHTNALQSDDLDVEWILKKIRNISSSDDDDIIYATISPVTVNKNQIPNVTCIMEKLGLGYHGNKNTTHDGVPCIDWSRNVALFTRYKLRGKNVTRNYCRNPDNDLMGPWCFVEKRSILKSQFKYKHCGVPLCDKSPMNDTKTYPMGVPMQLLRKCPTGFKMDKDSFCIVEHDFIEKLPDGSFSFLLVADSNTSSCYPGFRTERMTSRYLSLFTILCIKESHLNGTIEYPSYVSSPEYGQLIFMALSLSNNCPVMMNDTAILIKRPKYFRGITATVCYYFYKLSNKNYIEDRRLAFLTHMKDCPSGHQSRNMEYRWKFSMSNYNLYRSRSVYACVPNKDIGHFPDGNYCLLSIHEESLTRTIQCPNDFIKVSVGMPEQIFCCRQGSNEQPSLDIYNFFNFSSVLIINNGKECKLELNDSSIKISQSKYETIMYGRPFRCVNCDLVSAFDLINHSSIYRRSYSRISFTACNYEKIMNGFAYASMNSRCPPGMEYAYIKYSTRSYLNFRTITAIAKFCTKINYSTDISFPEGRYCIYKIGFKCPNGFFTNKEKLPLFSYKTSDSNGNLPNYNSDAYCCKEDTTGLTFENQSMPYVTSTFEFGLPFPNSSYNCIHGLSTHTAVDDSHMCEYTPRTIETSHTTVIFPSDLCSKPSYKFYGPLRLIYSANNDNRYCYYYVKNNPPPGKYCIISAKNCPKKYFYYVTYHPLFRAVICCRKDVSSDSLSENSTFTLAEWANDLKEFHLLAYKGKCEIFNGYNFGKRTQRLSIGYTIDDIGVEHMNNLTNIGVKIIKSRSYKVWINSCAYKMDPFNKSSTWPHGNYALPKTLMNCQSDFKSGYFTHLMESASPSFSHSDIIHLDGDYMIGGNKLKWGFCVKKDTFRKERLSLPYGRYCVMKVGSMCPIGFKDGSVKFVEITALNNLFIQRKGDLPEIDNDGPFITYHFCCQSGYGDVAHQTINLPIDSGPFYLLKYGTYCQKVEGMKFTEEFICIDSEDSAQFLNYTFSSPYKVEGFSPVTGSYVRGCDFQINLCYYDKDSWNSQISTKKPQETQGWPKGSYVFVKAFGQKCPPLFDEGKITVHAKFKIDQKFLSTLMFGANDDRESILTYCERNSTALDRLYPPESWPKGIYCVIFEKKCPQGMLRHKFKSIHNIVFTMSWENLCCKKDNITNPDELPFFPADQYSFLIQPTHEVHTCPPHKNMRVALINLQNEILCYYEKKDDGVEFPDGDYLLPAPWKPQYKCPPGFNLITHSHTNMTGIDQPSKELRFCQRDNQGTNNSEKTVFPRGNYCILTTNYKCPSTQFTDENILVIPLHQFSDQKNKLSRYLACCQNDGHLISNLVGMKVPFQMFGSTLCSYVDEMVNANEAEETTILQQRGVNERAPYIKANNKLRLCRYDQASLWNYDSRCQCHKDAECFLTFEDVKCRCRTGFFGDGKTTCSKVTNATGPCGNACNKIRSVCEGTANAVKCKCKEGFEGDGFTCKPSCNARICNAFSHCVVNSLESYCECLPNFIKTNGNRCYGDFLNTISLMDGFDELNNLNLSCLRKEAYNHLVNINTSRILFILMPPKREIFTTCNDVHNYYGILYSKLPPMDLQWERIIHTEGHRSLILSMTEKNQWTVNRDIEVLKADIFTNTIVLYLNESITHSFFERKLSKKLVSKDPIIAGYIFGVLSLIAVITVAIVCFLKRNRLFGFIRLHDSRSESNIHFLSSENKVEIE